MEEWIKWGHERLAVLTDCFGDENGFARYNESYGVMYDCPKLRSEFDGDELRTDIPGLNAMARALVSSLNDGLVAELLREGRMEGVDLTKEEAEKKAGEDLEDVLNFVKILLPQSLWEQLKWDTEEHEKTRANYSPGRYFCIWRRPIGSTGKDAELILIQLNAHDYCGSGGCTAPILGFLRVGEKYKTVFAQVGDGKIATYDTGRGNMPQIFTIDIKQGGISYQGRTIFCYMFDEQSVCYRPYLRGRIVSDEPYVGQQVPQDLAGSGVEGGSRPSSEIDWRFIR